MSTLGAALILLAVLGFSLTALFWQIGRARRVESERDRIIREAEQHDVGPDALRLLQELDAHLDAYAAAVHGLYEQPHISPDPVLAAGRERLWDAVRDNQNHHQGDQ
ncbi:hypothetical protein [Streptomyces viridochromogenes]|uniref:hypothetical protein n=1 Tax=Streptomyces viridochromogenes TaxID=1938 RepID=UPI00069CBE58|nr:hypothetical protein [Streptomyces viridochromogenes]KOG21769.1 hypothetical protein ADK36_12355 [Streptomyces viridochromogenes]